MPGTTAILDAFTRANSTTTLGANWSLATDFSLGGTNLGINTNAAYKGGGTGYVVMYWNVATFGPSCEAYMTVATEPTSGQPPAVYARLVNPGVSTLDGYNVSYTVGAPDSWAIKRSDNGTDTQLGASVSQAVAAGEKILIECIGSTIKGFLFTGGAWSEVLSRSDATYSAAGFVGMYGTGSDTTWRYDDFGGGTLASPSRPNFPPRIPFAILAR
jgi:hypothetical protein